MPQNPTDNGVFAQGRIVSRYAKDGAHCRLWSQSTTEASPQVTETTTIVSEPNPVEVRKTYAQKPRGVGRRNSPQNAAKGRPRRRLDFGVEAQGTKISQQAKLVTRDVKSVLSKDQGKLISKAHVHRGRPPRVEGSDGKLASHQPHALIPTRTPIVRNCGKTGPHLFTTPGGTDYIVTPGHHKIVLTEFLASFDKPRGSEPPVFTGILHYAEGMHKEWISREREIRTDVFLLSFPDSSPLEAFRQMAIQSIFNYAVEHKLHEKTVHLTALNISRVVMECFADRNEKTLTHELFAATVIAALRNAIKNDEAYSKSDLFRLEPEHVWKSSGYLREMRQVKQLNQIENECLKVLDKPANPPLAPEFLDRYLAVGGWPEYQTEYRDLGSYLLGLALFADGTNNPLRGTPGSLLAAAALVLAIKVVNTDNRATKYEFWPDRLVAYTNYSMDKLKPTIRGLAWMLRNKPKTVRNTQHASFVIVSTSCFERVFVSCSAQSWKNTTGRGQNTIGIRYLFMRTLIGS